MASDSVTSTPSVISSVSAAGSRPVSASTAATVAAIAGEATWRGERLTETLSGRSPRAAFQRAASAQARRSTRSPMREDRAALLGDRDELAGGDEPALGMVPAHERLDAR